MIVLGLALTAVLGWLTLPRRLEAGPVSGLALGFLWASFGISVELFLFDRLGLPGNPWIALAPWIAAAAWLIWRRRPSLSLELSLGASLHRFLGDADEGFWHGSFPVHLQLRLPLSQARDGGGLHLRAGAGAEYFMEFDADDFAPVAVDWSTDGGNFEFVAYLGFDWVMR